MIILLRQNYIYFGFEDALTYRKMFAGISKKSKQNKCME